MDDPEDLVLPVLAALAHILTELHIAFDQLGKIDNAAQGMTIQMSGQDIVVARTFKKCLITIKEQVDIILEKATIGLNPASVYVLHNLNAADEVKDKGVTEATFMVNLVQYLLNTVQGRDGYAPLKTPQGRQDVRDHLVNFQQSFDHMIILMSDLGARSRHPQVSEAVLGLKETSKGLRLVSSSGSSTAKASSVIRSSSSSARTDPRSKENPSAHKNPDYGTEKIAEVLEMLHLEKQTDRMSRPKGNKESGYFMPGHDLGLRPEGIYYPHCRKFGQNLPVVPSRFVTAAYFSNPHQLHTLTLATSSWSI
jgi:hypothetical protein